MTRTGKTEVLEEKPVPLRPFPTKPHINWPHIEPRLELRNERRHKRCAMRITTFIISRGGETENFILLQAPRQCPNVLLAKVG
jgi:hypothetical protein